MQCYMPATGMVHISDTLQNIPKSFALTKITTEYDIKQAIGDIIAIIQDPLKTFTFFSYGDEIKNVINQIAPHKTSPTHMHDIQGWNRLCNI